MNPLSPIPIPVSQRWREFRIKVLPFVVFACATVSLSFLWKENVAAPTLIGQVEAPRADVMSPDSGVITNLWVTRFQTVKAGDAVAEIIAADPKNISSFVQTIRGKTAMAQLELDTRLDKQRNAFDFQRLRLDLMRQRVDLATARVNLQLAEKEEKRTAALFREHLVSDSEYDQVKKTRDALAAEVRERDKLVIEMERTLGNLKLLAESFETETTNNPIAETLAGFAQAKDRLTDLEREPLILRAPIGGTVTLIHRRPGETILAGEPIVTITSTEGERIVGYLRQPLSFQPKVGMAVRIRRQSEHREETVARILEVGKDFQAILPQLTRPGAQHEIGLPISVSMPVDFKLFSGEVVDLKIQTATRVGSKPAVISGGL